MSLNLTKSQKEGFKEFKKFLDSSETCICISGKPGVGKTFFVKEVLVPYIEDNYYQQIIITATTNKASNIIGGKTTYSAFGLKMNFNESTGKYNIDTKNVKTFANSIIFIDEASMLDKILLDIVLRHIIHCKIVFIGDKNQLPAVGSSINVFEKYPVIELTDVVRQKKQDLIDCIESAKECISQATMFKPVESENVHIITEGSKAKDIISSFTNSDKILSFLNERVIGFNQAYRQILAKPSEFKEGDLVVCKSYASTYEIQDNIPFIDSFYAEEEAIITDISEPHKAVYRDQEINFMVQTVHVNTKSAGFYIPCNPVLYRQYLNCFAKDKAWGMYYFFKEKIADLRDNNACTIHASQGSTYDRVFIDYDTIVHGKGQSIGNKARMLYVALSRAKEEIFIYSKELKK